MLKWTSESEYFLSFENFFADTIVYIYQSKSNHLTPRCACAARGKKSAKWVLATSLPARPSFPLTHNMGLAN